MLLFRHAQLVLVNLVNHPDAGDASNRRGLLAAEKQVKINIRKLEALKPEINKRYERYQRLLRERETRRTEASELRDVPPNAHAPLIFDPALSGTAQPLEAGENRELAVQLARQEINRRETIRRARASGISPDEERARRTGGIWGHWERALDEQKAGNGPDELSRRIQEVRQRMEESHEAPNVAGNLTRQTEISSGYRYPTVPKYKTQEFHPQNVPELAESLVKSVDSTKAPVPPPKEFNEEPPPRPSKLSTAGPPVPSKRTVETSTQQPDPSDLNPSTFTFKPSAYLENKTPLRTVFLPPTLRSEFLRLADSNTRRNLETCGILCGTLISNAFFISKLLIPEQESTSDTCETVNESAIFDYCDSEDLMVLGWIHTHPTQTCFMSSRDLHTHCGYQAMLPESIAIVCAPSKDPDWGVFRLTDPPGLKSVLNCTQKGLFHPHAETNLYTDALRPGHVYEAKGLEFETVDLRPGI